MRPRREQDYTETGERRYDDIPLSIRIGAICSCVCWTISVTFLYREYLDPLFWKGVDWLLALFFSPGAPPPV